MKSEEIILQANTKVTQPALVSATNKHQNLQEEEFKKLLQKIRQSEAPDTTTGT